MPKRRLRSKPASRTCSVRACSTVANSNRNPSLLPNDSGSEAAVPQQLCFSCCASDGFASAALPQLLCLSCFASAALPQLLVPQKALPQKSFCGSAEKDLPQKLLASEAPCLRSSLPQKLLASEAPCLR